MLTFCQVKLTESSVQMNKMYDILWFLIGDRKSTLTVELRLKDLPPRNSITLSSYSEVIIHTLPSEFTFDHQKYIPLKTHILAYIHLFIHIYTYIYTYILDVWICMYEHM